ncbi:hypothetical protein BGX26_008853 [Mortierella sp. AD094]|nr:hypothetical protein BGX26_008853 [Mortierella sp. AD094]
MKRIPPQRPRAAASQPQSPGIIQNYGNKARAATSDTYSYSQSRRNNSKSDYKASESSQHQQCALRNNSSGAADSSHENSEDDDFEVDSRKTRRTENQIATSGPQRHQPSSGPRLTSGYKRDLGKKTSKVLPGQQALSDCDETLDEHWPSIPDQMDFDYKLDSDSPLESSPVMGATRNAQSALPLILDANRDTIDDIDKLLMEDALSSRLAPMPRIPSSVHSTKRQDDAPEAKAPKSKNGLGDTEDKNIHKDKGRPGNFAFDSDEFTYDGRKLESKAQDESKTKYRGPDAQPNAEDLMSVCQDTDRNKAPDQAMSPLVFDIPVRATDFKSRLGGLSDRFMTSLNNMVEAIQ